MIWFHNKTWNEDYLYAFTQLWLSFHFWFFSLRFAIKNPKISQKMFTNLQRKSLGCKSSYWTFTYSVSKKKSWSPNILDEVHVIYECITTASWEEGQWVDDGKSKTLQKNDHIERHSGSKACSNEIENLEKSMMSSWAFRELKMLKKTSLLNYLLLFYHY